MTYSSALDYGLKANISSRSPTHHFGDNYVPDLAPRSTPPLLPTRRNIFDDDEFDQLAIDASRLHFGRRNPSRTADEILQDRSSAPNKAAIDVEDVGGTVDSATPGNNPEEANTYARDAHEETLFRALKMTPGVFDRDGATRRGKARIALKEQTEMTDEAIEGWALMLSRDPRRLKRLEAKFSSFSAAQRELNPTASRGDPGGSATEDSDLGGSGRGSGGFRGRGGRGRSARGRDGNVAGPAGERGTEIARHKKEANKGSRANHNRRDQRAKKMARGGFPG